jgi:hypothetical protein
MIPWTSEKNKFSVPKKRSFEFRKKGVLSSEKNGVYFHELIAPAAGFYAII